MTAQTNTALFLVDDTSDLPIWVQLRNRFEYLIRTGYFKEGDQIPSVRSLAATAKINYNTVTRAYRELELEGLVLSVRGRGMYVQAIAPENEELNTAPADALFDNCVRQYRSFGMTYDDIRAHMDKMLTSLEDEAEEKTRKRMDLCS